MYARNGSTFCSPNLMMRDVTKPLFWLFNHRANALDALFYSFSCLLCCILFVFVEVSTKAFDVKSRHSGAKKRTYRNLVALPLSTTQSSLQVCSQV
jgi:hypothetical protein